MHQDEYWQVFDKSGEPIPGEGWAADLDNPEKTGSDKIVGAVLIFLYRINDAGELEILWQKRSDTVSRWPGKYDSAAGGHINLGESLMDAAIRESREEIGAEISVSDLQYMGSFTPRLTRLVWAFMVDYSGRPDDFHFDDNEVSEVKWVSYKDLDVFRNNYLKKPLAESVIVFEMIDEWLKMHGII